MATLEAVTVELQNLNGLENSQLSAMLEQKDAIGALSTNMNATNVILGNILGVMQDFIKAVPEEISKGYDALLSFQERQAILDARKEKEEDTPKSKPTKPETDDGFFKSNFNKGMEKNFGFMDAIKDNIAEVIVVAGTLAAISKKTFGGIVKSLKFLGRMVLGLGKVLLGGIKILATVLRGVFAAISLPFALITAALAGLALGIYGFVTDFQEMEGTFMDKWIAGLGGFAKGFFKIITVPLDLLKDAISWVAGALGFEDFEKTLDGFSFTEGFAELIDDAVQFIIDIKDLIVNKVKGVINGLGEMFGLDPIFEDKPEAATPEQTTPEQTTPTSPAKPEVKRSYPVYSPEGELVSEAASPEEASQKAMSVGGYVGNPSVVAEGPTTSAPKQVVASPSVPTKVKTDDKKVATVAEGPTTSAPKQVVASPSVPTKVKTDDKKVATVAASKPKKVKIPEGVRVTPAGKYASYNSVTNSQETFSSVDEAVTFMGAPIEVAAEMSPYAATIYAERQQSAPKKVLRSKSANAAPIINAVGPQPSVSVISDAPSVSSSISTSNDRVVMSEVMSVEQNKLDENRAVSNSVSGGNMVVAPTNNTSVVNNQTINSGPMPSAMDKSDRTDRRGAFRGRVI